jgi:hypothetical protein
MLLQKDIILLCVSFFLRGGDHISYRQQRAASVSNMQDTAHHQSRRVFLKKQKKKEIQ